MNIIVKKIIKPWIVICDGYPCRVFQFDTLKEATAFAKAEQAADDEETRDFYRRMAEDDADAEAWNAKQDQ